MRSALKEVILQNPYFKARIAATVFDDVFVSRAATAREIGICTTNLALIENGKRKPLPEEIALMAKAYRAPQLVLDYCRHQCPFHLFFTDGVLRKGEDSHA